MEYMMEHSGAPPKCKFKNSDIDERFKYTKVRVASEKLEKKLIKKLLKKMEN